MHIVIIGNGISGTTAARFIRKKSDCRITLISEESKYPFSRTALMFIYMGHLKIEHTKLYHDDFWVKNKIDLMLDKVLSIDVYAKEIKLVNNDAIVYDKLIIATGSKSNKSTVPGSECKGVHGLYHLRDLQGMEAASGKIQRAVIVGGGLIGIEMAEMFRSRNIDVTMIVREKNYWDNVLPEEEALMINKHIIEHGIDLRLNAELSEIKEENGEIRSVITKSGKEIICNYVGVTIGVSPNIDFLKESAIKINRGIVVDEYLQTSISDIYAAGDCVELSSPQEGRRAIEPVWYTGRMMGQVVASNVLGHQEKYNPGIWFNSAKFFDIEYQVYGHVPNVKSTEYREFYWKHNQKNESVRIVFNLQDEVVGFNLLGIRYRQEVCEKWIREKTLIDTVMSQLSLANFDPEFFAENEPNIIAKYNAQYKKSVKAKTKRSLSMVQKFLRLTNQGQ